jgi:hypothetical protein
MNEILAIIGMTLLFFLVMSIIIGIPYLILKLIERRAFRNWKTYLGLIPIMILSFYIYEGIYPSNDFYKQDFRTVTGLDFPENGVINYKTASYPDQHGDYTSISIIDVDELFYNKLRTHLLSIGFKDETNPVGSTQFSEEMNHISEQDIIGGLSLTEGYGTYYYVGFLSNRRTIIVERSSW